MRRPTRSKQSDLFSVPAAILPLTLPASMRADLASLISALLLEVLSHPHLQPVTAHQEPDHEQQDHA